MGWLMTRLTRYLSTWRRWSSDNVKFIITMTSQSGGWIEFEEISHNAHVIVCISSLKWVEIRFLLNFNHACLVKGRGKIHIFGFKLQ